LSFNTYFDINLNKLVNWFLNKFGDANRRCDWCHRSVRRIDQLHAIRPCTRLCQRCYEDYFEDKEKRK